MNDRRLAPRIPHAACAHFQRMFSHSLWVPGITSFEEGVAADVVGLGVEELSIDLQFDTGDARRGRSVVDHLNG